MNRPIAEGLALRTGFLTLYKDSFGSELARAFLSDEAQKKCPRFAEIRQDFRDVLERSAKK
jgi:hypothetical protein